MVAATRDTEIGKYSRFHLSMIRTDASLAITASPQVLGSPASVFVTERRTVVLRGFTGLVTDIRWYRNGILIPGANANELTIISATSADAGQYTMEAVNGAGALKSAAATVTVGGYVPSPVIWKQSTFVIGTFWDATMQGSSTLADEGKVKMMWDAGIRHATGLNSGPGSTLFSSPNPSDVTNTYRLARHAAQCCQYSIPMMATDKRFLNSIIPYRQDSVTASANDYKTLPTNQRTALLGYHITDEPWYRTINRSVDDTLTFSLGDNLLKLEQIQAVDPARPGYVNLRANWGFDTEDQYKEYVEQFALHRDTKIMSFDYYVLDAGKANGYLPLSGRVSFFWHNRLFANSVRLAKTTLGKDISFWGYGCSSEHTLSDGRHMVNPDLSQLRYYANVPMLYGANGLIWFTFAKIQNADYLNGPEIDAALRTRMASVNYWANVFGNWVKDMEWVATVHGSTTDPYSGETGLDDVAAPTGQVVFRPEHGFPPQFAVGIFKSKFAHKYALSVFDTINIFRSDHLLIMNKNITKPGTNNIPGPDSWNFRVQGYPRGIWITRPREPTMLLPRTVNAADNSVSFPVNNLDPGAVHLVYLQRIPVSILLNPLIL
ncbi:MAG: hypothetical protein ABIW76_08760 [Fibrobacteria bacterium]